MMFGLPGILEQFSRQSIPSINYCPLDDTDFFDISGIGVIPINYCPQDDASFYDITRPTFGTWNPSEITPYLWLDATDETTFTLTVANLVTEWRDKSGNGFHCEQPTLALKPYYSPDASDQPPTDPAYLGFNLNWLATVDFSSTRFLQCLNWNMTGSQHTFIAFATRTINSSSRLFTQSDAGLDTATGGYIPALMTSSTTIGSYLAGNRATRPISSQQGYIFDSVYNGTSVTNRISGEVTGASFTNSVTKTFTRYFLNSNTAGANTSNPLIGEIVVFNRVLTQTEREQMQGYLSWKWGLVSKLPSGHPYKIFPPNI